MGCLKHPFFTKAAPKAAPPRLPEKSAFEYDHIKKRKQRHKQARKGGKSRNNQSYNPQHGGWNYGQSQPPQDNISQTFSALFQPKRKPARHNNHHRGGYNRGGGHYNNPYPCDPRGYRG